MSKDKSEPAGKVESVAFTDREHKLIVEYAEQRGLSISEAASELFSQALATRVRKRTGRSPAKNVLKMRR